MNNQTMTVKIGEHSFKIEHQTMIGNLNQFWACGNAYRLAKGQTPKHLENWLRSQETAEFIQALERDFKSVESTDLNNTLKINNNGTVNTIKSPLIKSKRGKGGGTWAHLYILLDAATHLDPDFKVMVYKSFVEQNLLKNRDDAGNNYKPMNQAIGRLIKKNGDDARPYFIEFANLIAEKIGVSKHESGENKWNFATAEQLAARSEIEKKIKEFIDLGFVNDYEHLKLILNRI